MAAATSNAKAAIIRKTNCEKTLILEGCPTTPDETDNCQQAAHGDNDDTNLKEHGVFIFGRIYFTITVNKYHCCKCYHCNSYKLAKTHSNPQQHIPAEGKTSFQVLPSRSKVTLIFKLNVSCSAEEVGPIPTIDVNLQKDRPVCFEGHGNHFVKRVTWCRGWVRKGRLIIKQVQYSQGLGGEGEKKIRIKGERKGYRHQLGVHHRHGNNSCELHVPTGFFIALPARNNCCYLMPMFKYIICLFNYGVVLLLGVVSLMAGSTTGVPCFLHQPHHQLDCSSLNQFAVMVNYNVVLLSAVVSLMVGSTTSLLMSFGYGYQTAMPTLYYAITTYASAGYYTIKASGNYTTTYDSPSYCTDDLNYRYPSVAASKFCTIKFTIDYGLIISCFDGWVDHWCTDVSFTNPITNWIVHRLTSSQLWTYSNPGNVNLQKEKNVNAIQTSEVTEIITYNRGIVYYTNIDPDCHAASNRYIEAPKYYTIEEYYDVMLLLDVVSLMAGSTTSIPMSPGYGGFQIDNWCFATAEDGDIVMWCWCSDVSWFITPRNLSFLQVNTCSELLPYTINAPECYTTAYAAPNYCTDVLKYYTIKPQPIRNLG
ncbi:hypothetical protein DAPPUDRAFT_310518 [Daphnia pulex]|uniref:Uncharacterized protein n=1 Tax=Daphnia pulex TaxID=6669 RepID=E9FTW8_DAPPU|nr:hypothetical protein DAPPUDRAFT_310518 [Daphnia pulex]|eukprot:EFX89440.1 hypothetical protein DAPPUDRAFT_310518 [Daphnia pulex]